jgi:Leucine-rich repeat (LRR) protein
MIRLRLENYYDFKMLKIFIIFLIISYDAKSQYVNWTSIIKGPLFTFNDQKMIVLNGIEKFTELRRLTLKNDTIISIDKLKSLINIIYLDLSSNRIRDLVLCVI